MGYANMTQVGTGLRQRIYARSFIIGDPSDKADRFVYMVLDTQSGDSAVRNGILEGLQDLGADYSVYSQSNVAVTGTHSHSGPVSKLELIVRSFLMSLQGCLAQLSSPNNHKQRL